MKSTTLFCGLFLLQATVINIVQTTCVFESDFGFKINCAFKKSGLFRVRNLGGLKAHASLGFSLGDELGFEQSLTNLDPSRRRSVSVKNGAPPNLVLGTSTSGSKQEKRGKQNRIMMRPVMPPPSRPNQVAMDRLSSLHHRVTSTMQPIIVPAPAHLPIVRVQGATMAKPMPMGVPPFRPLPPKEDTLKVLPITSSTRKHYTPLQVPESKGPGLAYQSERLYPQSQNQISKMVSQMTAVQYAHPMLKITPAPIIVHPQIYSAPNHVNQFVPMPFASPPTQSLTIIPAPAFKGMPNSRNTQSTYIQNTNPISNFIDPVPHQVHNIANNYVYNTKKVDEYNTITGYGDDTTLKFTKEDINAKIAEIAKAGNISMEAVEAAISLRQQQLLNKYANIPLPSTTTTTTTSTTEPPVVFEPEPEILLAAVSQKPQRLPTSGKVMNAPKEYYPVGYEKDFDDHFQSKVDLPDTNFHCGDQKYFPGLYGDESLGCMVFHVCALTDDGLVMKSFLCPESTLFDQTILKCNWWFYVDCKNTRKLYETNIPVSKSYQLMKALTFFSSYKKEMQDDGHPTNPEDVEGINEAISILENQEPSKPSQLNSGTDALQIITPQPIIDERNNKKSNYPTESSPSPIYRSNRNLNNFTTFDSVNKTVSDPQETSDYRLVTVNADMNFNKSEISNSAEANNTSLDKDRKHRRRMTIRFGSSTQKSTTTTTVTPKPIISDPIVATTPSVEIIKQEIQPIEHFSAIRQEKLTDQLDDLKVIESPSPVRRFYRSSAEKIGERNDREMAVVNKERVQIVRPTTTSTLVGYSPTQKAAIDKLDAAVLGQPILRFKKEALTIVTPQRHFHRILGFPERRVEKRLPQYQDKKELKQRESSPRDCKGKCATSIAQKAAAEAKAAQAAQNAAGAQAAHMVKTQLAEKALQAAKAAEAALAGKQAVVEQLQQEVKEAEAVVAENTAAVHQQQGTVNAAVQAAQQATAQHKLLIQATQLAAQMEKSAHCVLDKTKFGLQEKCHNLSEARARLAHLQHKLQCACTECAATKQAAHCACESARAACGNARKKKHVTNENALALREPTPGR